MASPSAGISSRGPRGCNWRNSPLRPGPGAAGWTCRSSASALRQGSPGQRRRRAHSRLRKRSVEFLAPVRNGSAGAVDGDQVQWLCGRVRQLVEDARREKHGLTLGNPAKLRSDANLALALQHHVSLFLLLVEVYMVLKGEGEICV